MLLSMTGFGEASRQADGISVSIELRTINSRHFKLSFRASDGFGSLEPRVEAMVREQIYRGTVNLQLRVQRPASADDFRINVPLMESLEAKLAPFLQKRGETKIPIETLLALPGVMEEIAGADREIESDWPLIAECLAEALQKMSEMRLREGESLCKDLLAQGQVIQQGLLAVEKRASTVVTTYREKLLERVNQSLSELNVTVEPQDLVREITLFADRSDISEEMVRLRSHLQQFEQTIEKVENAGKKLEFIAQEMGREINTIGSKANDSQIAKHVVDMKTALERIREQVQNVE